MLVVVRDSCPSAARTDARPVPFRTCWVAKVCRRLCVVAADDGGAVGPATPAVPAVLARHGIAPDADEAALLAALAARGWAAQVEEVSAARGGAARFRALATRARSPAEVAAGGRLRVAHDHVQGSGRTAEAALRRVLAAVLERAG